MPSVESSSSSSNSTPPLGKFLASSDKTTRDKAIESLRAFLSSGDRVLSPPEMAKLWKGIFYCYWMSDKPLVQQALSSELASLAASITDSIRALAFFQGFWAMVVREWNGIDRLRMDKYYMLVRKFVNGGFRFLVREEWNGSCVDEWNTMLSKDGGPLDPTDPRVPSSLCYHLADIYLEELETVVFEPSGAPPIVALVTPFIRVLSLTPSKITYSRISTCLFSPLFASLSPLQQEEPDLPHIIELLKSDLGLAPVRAELLRTFFQAASQENTKDVNRRRMYATWRSEKAEDDDDDGERAAE